MWRRSGWDFALADRPRLVYCPNLSSSLDKERRRWGPLEFAHHETRWGHRRRRIILFAARVLSGYDATDVPRCERPMYPAWIYTAHSHASNISLAGVLTLPLHRDAWLTFPPHIHRENNTTHITSRFTLAIICILAELPLAAAADPK